MIRAAALLALLFSIAAAAQPQPFFEAETDKAAYASGEPITVTVSITNPTPEDLQYWFSSGCLVSFVLDGERNPEACTLAEVPLDIGAGLRWEYDAIIYPDSSGYPETGGTHTLVAQPNVSSVGDRANPPYTYPEDLRLSDARVTFTAPAADAGVVAVLYPVETAPSTFDALRDSLNADVVRASADRTYHYETWQVSGAPLASIVAAYEGDARFTAFEASLEYRMVRGSESRIVTSNEAPPEARLDFRALGSPCAGACIVALATPASAQARVVAYDALGREVAVLHDGPLAPGPHRWALPPWLRAGLYVVRAQTPEAAESVEVVVAR